MQSRKSALRCELMNQKRKKEPKKEDMYCLSLEDHPFKLQLYSENLL
jgi:hypothetical protein